jgi:hypothetical protein
MIGCFPEPHADELLYSVVSRHARRMRYTTKTAVALELFGTTNQYQSIEFPARLKHLADNLPPGHSSTIDSLVWEHTMLPYYARFLSSSRVDEIENRMRSQSARGWTDQARISPDRIRQSKWLRFCPTCVVHDRQTCGEAYWHRSHQLPGCEFCPVHGTQLSNSDVVIRNRTHLARLIAVDDAFSCAPLLHSDIDSDFHQNLKAIGEETSWLLANSQKSDAGINTSAIYRDLLRKRGLIDGQDRLKQRKLNHAFIDHFPPGLLELLGCNINPDRKTSWIVQLAIEGYDHAQHPLHHLLMMQFLEITTSEFFAYGPIEIVEHISSDSTSPFGLGPWPCLNPVCNHYRMPVIEQVTVTKNVSNKQPEGTFACICGYIYLRFGPDRNPADDIYRKNRVKEYGRLWMQHFESQWRDPMMNLRQIAESLGVSPMTVKRVAIRNGFPIPRLCHSGNRRTVRMGYEDVIGPIERRAALLEHRRKQWIELIEQHPEVGVEWMNRTYGRIYNYLRRNDPQWLQAHLPTSSMKPRKAVGTRTKHHSQEMDAVIADEVRKIAQELRHSDGPPVRITRTAILARLQHNISFPVIQRNLPVSHQCLVGAVESNQEFALRKLAWFTDRCQITGERVSRSELIRRLHLTNWVDDSAVAHAIQATLVDIGA